MPYVLLTAIPVYILMCAFICGVRRRTKPTELRRRKLLLSIRNAASLQHLADMEDEAEDYYQAPGQYLGLTNAIDKRRRELQGEKILESIQ